jgi:hypothetical protein
MPASVPFRPEAAFERGADLPALRRCPSIDEALSRMMYLAEHRRPLGIVCGPPGCGKSDLLQLVFGELRGQGVLLDMATIESGLFGWTLAAALGLGPCWSQPPWMAWRRVEDHLQGRCRSGRPLTLLLNRLDLADAHTLQCVERLMAPVHEGASVSVLAAGQLPLPLGLHELMRRQADVRIELGPLGPEEVRLYVEGLTRQQGLPAFDKASITALHARTGGRLRDLRRCALLALLAAETEECPAISPELVALAAEELPGRVDASAAVDLLYS